MKYAPDTLRLFKTHFEDRGMDSKPTRMSLVVVSTHPKNGLVKSIDTPDGAPKGPQSIFNLCNLWPSGNTRFLTQCSIKTSSDKYKPNQ